MLFYDHLFIALIICLLLFAGTNPIVKLPEKMAKCFLTTNDIINIHFYFKFMSISMEDINKSYFYIVSFLLYKEIYFVLYHFDSFLYFPSEQSSTTPIKGSKFAHFRRKKFSTQLLKRRPLVCTHEAL